MKIQQVLQESIELKQNILQQTQILDNIQKAIEIIYNALKNGNKVFFCGNGGSAADAQHLAAEFSGRFYIDREPLPVEALHCNTSYLTAVANDYHFDVVYSRLVKAVGNSGDILVGLSTSGNSKNILNAFEVANDKKMITIALTGQSGGKLKNCSNILINVPSNDTPRIQEAHITIGHIICELVESRLYKVFD